MYDEWKAAMPPLAAGIAQHLGLGWTVDMDREDWGHGFWLDGPGGLRLYVEKGDRYDMPKKISVIGLYPPEAPIRMTRYSIGVSINRGGEQIARDIERRLLPDYRAELQRAHEQIERQESAVCRRFALRDELLEVLAPVGGTLISHRQSENRSEVTVNGVHDGGSIDVELNNDGSQAKIELRWISADMARAVVAAFMEQADREGRVKRRLTAV